MSAPSVGIAFDAPSASRDEPRIGRERRGREQLERRPRTAATGAPASQQLAGRVVAGAGQLEELTVQQAAAGRSFRSWSACRSCRSRSPTCCPVFRRRQTPHERLALDHAAHADGQGNGHHRRQRLRDDRDGKRDAEHEHLDDRQPARQADGDDDRDDGERALAECGAEAIQVLLQRCAARFDASPPCGRCGRTRWTSRWRRRAPGPGRATTIVPAYAMFVRSPSGRRASSSARRGLLYGRRLAGERRLVDRKIDGLDDARVGGHAVARPQHDDVPGHQLARGNDDLLAVAQDARGRAPPSS